MKYKELINPKNQQLSDKELTYMIGNVLDFKGYERLKGSTTSEKLVTLKDIFSGNVVKSYYKRKPSTIDNKYIDAQFKRVHLTIAHLQIKPLTKILNG